MASVFFSLSKTIIVEVIIVAILANESDSTGPHESSSSADRIVTRSD
jgi:hypothetical protein